MVDTSKRCNNGAIKPLGFGWGRGRRPIPTITELARMKVLKEMGEGYKAIGRAVGYHESTVKRWIKDYHYHYDDPCVQELMAHIRKNELDDLALIGAKARKRLHELLDKGDSHMIETTAVLDRTFQQKQLLEGKATQIFDISRHAELELKAKELAERIIELRQKETEEETKEIECQPSLKS